MPKAYRTMLEDGGSPKIGPRFLYLGVREPGGPSPQPDVDLDETGCVKLNQKGMSVFRSLNDLRDLVPHLVPRHLKRHHRGAAARDGARIFSIGDGGYCSGTIANRLALVADSEDMHGSIVPDALMPLAEFQAALAATREMWAIDEPAE